VQRIGTTSNKGRTIIRPSATSEHDGDDIIYPSVIPFLLVHIACLAAVLTGITWRAAAIGIVLYWARMFGVVAGYHRLFSHRSYVTGRTAQFLLAVLAQSSGQKSVLWWAAKHRHHHLHSDTPQDVHSPVHKGFLYSHVGWIFARKHDVADLAAVPDLTRYPELVWLHKFEQLPAICLGVACLLAAGWPGVVVGFCWSTVLVYHATFCINSLAHVSGRKRYVTGDQSRNNWLLAVLTMGEGWHNNHHAYPSSVRQGFRWWELDIAYYLLQASSWTGIVWGLKTPPQSVLRNEQRLGSKVLDRVAAQLAARFNTERIAACIAATLHGPELANLRAALSRAQDHASDLLGTMQLPSMPGREELLAEAKAIFAKTRSLDDIVDRAYELILESVRSYLVPARLSNAAGIMQGA
jgi:stearoyl-CoA desaturase (delta-9 desaturase)